MTFKINRPWGTEDLFVQNESVTVKLLYIKAGEQLSLQYHNHRTEFWKIISGEPEAIIGDEILQLKIGDEIDIKIGQKHRLSAPAGNVTILEISKGNFDENDEVKLDDKYGRH